jgi:hypothetical protein
MKKINRRDEETMIYIKIETSSKQTLDDTINSIFINCNPSDCKIYRNMLKPNYEMLIILPPKNKF